MYKFAKIINDSMTTVCDDSLFHQIIVSLNEPDSQLKKDLKYLAIEQFFMPLQIFTDFKEIIRMELNDNESDNKSYTDDEDDESYYESDEDDESDNSILENINYVMTFFVMTVVDTEEERLEMFNLLKSFYAKYQDKIIKQGGLEKIKNYCRKEVIETQKLLDEIYKPKPQFF